MASNASSIEAPSDLVELGRIVSPYGVRGWVKIQPHASGGETLLAAATWWLRAPVPPGRSEAAQPQAKPMQVVASRPQGATVVAQLTEIPDRDVAQALKGHTVWVPRADFPASDEDEYYWVDLIGCRLYGEDQGQSVLIGLVEEVIDNSAHAVLRVLRYTADASGVLQPVPGPRGKPLEVLVPFVQAHVHTVDIASKRLDSNWPAEF